MSLFRKRPKYTDADARVVGFFFSQYVEVMKHGRDATDERMKRYIADVIHALGVPAEIQHEEEDQQLIEAQPYPIIHRRK